MACECQRLSCYGSHEFSFSPLHEGDTSVATPQALRCILRPVVSVPFTKGGTPSWPMMLSIARTTSPLVMFQSPSLGGHLCGPLLPAAPLRSPFACFSPLHEGDTSVAPQGV